MFLLSHYHVRFEHFRRVRLVFECVLFRLTASSIINLFIISYFINLSSFYNNKTIFTTYKPYKGFANGTTINGFNYRNYREIKL